ncbi:MAG: hypothetical protein ACR2PL_00755 [Dehalococcoidia bacterium]
MRSEDDDRLYQRYGKALEADHTGEWVAISPTGELIVGTEDAEVTQEALQRFGTDDITVRRIGCPYDYRIRVVHFRVRTQ